MWIPESEGVVAITIVSHHYHLRVLWIHRRLHHDQSHRLKFEKSERAIY